MFGEICSKGALDVAGGGLFRHADKLKFAQANREGAIKATASEREHGENESSVRAVVPSRSVRARRSCGRRMRQYVVGIVRYSVLAELSHHTHIATDDLKLHVGGSTLWLM